MTLNEQEKFWADTYEAEYQQRNSSLTRQYPNVINNSNCTVV